jgi:hypothetical protein
VTIGELKQYRRQAEKLARRLPDMPEIDTELVGRGLGLASLGIAAAELAVPGQIEKMLGIRDGRPDGARHHRARRVVREAS